METKVISFVSGPDQYGTLLPWARWNSPHRWLPEDVYDHEGGFKDFQSFIAYWKKHIKALVTSTDYVEHLVLAVGLVIRDIHAAQFAVDDPDEVDTTPPYCDGGALTIQFEDLLLKFLRLVADTIDLLPQGEYTLESFVTGLSMFVLKELLILHQTEENSSPQTVTLH